MVSRNFIKIIVYGFVLMFLSAGLMYGFAQITKDKSAQNEADYITRLTQYVDNMKKIEVDELAMMQTWKAEKIDAGTAVSQFADFKSKRQTLDDDFFSKAAPVKFTQIHFNLKDANTLWMQADDLYREGIFQRRNDFITDADAIVVTAKVKFNDAIAQLEKLGYKI